MGWGSTQLSKPAQAPSPVLAADPSREPCPVLSWILSQGCSKLGQSLKNAKPAGSGRDY